MDSNIKNIAYVDGQNLYMNTAKKDVDPWRISMSRFRVYLQKKYGVEKGPLGS